MKKNAWKAFAAWVNGTAEKPLTAPRTGPNGTREKRRLLHLDEEKKVRLFKWEYRAVALIVCLTVVAVLLFTVFHLPLFGEPNNPAVNEVVERYV